jgi:hypothetical protein
MGRLRRQVGLVPTFVAESSGRFSSQQCACKYKKILHYLRIAGDTAMILPGFIWNGAVEIPLCVTLRTLHGSSSSPETGPVSSAKC